MYSPLFFFGFWLGIPIVLLILFALFKPKLAPLTALICPAADLMVYWQEFLYYESRGKEPCVNSSIARAISFASGSSCFKSSARKSCKVGTVPV